MIELKAAYWRKLGDSDCNSEGFHASAKQKLSDTLSATQLKSHIHEMAAMLRQAVVEELNGPDGSGSNPTTKPSEGGEQPAGGPSVPGSNQARRPATVSEKATNKQVKFITDLAGQLGLALSDLNADIRKRYGVGGLYDLDRKQASDLLNELNGRKKAA